MTVRTHALLDYWSPARGDNFSTATEVGERSAVEAGYTRVRAEGRVWEERFVGAEPLTLWWSAERQDNFTTPPSGEPAARDAGYTKARVEGYVERTMPTGRPFSRYRSWWHPQREDNYLSGSLQGDDDARASGYRLVRVAECFGPAARALALVWTTTRTGIPDKPVIRFLNGSGFSPGGTVRTIAINLAAGFSDPVREIGSSVASGSGECTALPVEKTLPTVPGSPWITLVVDERSCSEIALSAALSNP